MRLPDPIRIVEVGPRDGLQNESAVVATDVKVEFVDRLAATGVQVVEATSFVSPRWVPQLADGAEVMARIQRRPGVRYAVLVPNERGLEAATDARVDEVAVFTAASEAFTKRNINRTIAESLEMFAPVVSRAVADGIRVRGYVSTALGCPFQGHVPPEDVLRVTAALFDLGVDEVSLGDTIGVGTPGQVQDLVALLSREVDVARLAAHMHDTFGQGLANTFAAFEAGVTVADTSAGGLGGCPYAPGAKGNLATEDLVYALHGSGYDTGIDLDALVDTTTWMAEQLGKRPASRAVEAIVSKRALDA